MAPIREFVTHAGANKQGIQSLDKNNMRGCVRTRTQAHSTLGLSVVCAGTLPVLPAHCCCGSLSLVLLLLLLLTATD
jgi:hypothetical protein